MTIMRCISCGYDLRELKNHACPECGRAFDPEDPATFLQQGWRDRTLTENYAELRRILAMNWPSLLFLLSPCVLWGMFWFTFILQVLPQDPETDEPLSFGRQLLRAFAAGGFAGVLFGTASMIFTTIPLFIAYRTWRRRRFRRHID